MAIAMQIVGRYVTVKGRFDDEWVSVAFLAVVQAVKRAQHTLINDNITPYIISAVHSALSEFMAEDRVIPIPYSTLRRNKLQPPTITNKGDAEIFSHEKQIVARELLESACITPVDRKIIDMRVRGYTDSDIAKAIGISRQYVQTIRAKLEKRIKELYEL
jgi:RNA polymerase sigma factor (sigma-70 family)